ncbi:hypothetical protein, partial [Picosynechococcus sp. PCC 7002]|uniref:hypothetical protein n=1 Tax=Picosynechococcus sp. (strain ATCC 27264 / PCC 7002 / PR-6) TaxID=32049 RepID=UPI001C3C405E
WQNLFKIIYMDKKNILFDFFLFQKYPHPFKCVKLGGISFLSLPVKCLSEFYEKSGRELIPSR